MRDSQQTGPSPTPSAEVIREFNDRGFQWLMEEQNNLRDLLMLFTPELAAHLDFSRVVYEQRLLIPADLRKRERDVLVRLAFVDETSGQRLEVLVYLLVEHQSQTDKWMGLRVLLYMTGVWQQILHKWDAERTPEAKRVLPPIIPMVFYTGKTAWTEPISLEPVAPVPDLLRTFLPSWQTLLLSLSDLSLETLRRQTSGLAEALKVWQAEDAPFEALEARFDEALLGLQSLEADAPAEWTRALWFLVLLSYHRRSREDYERLMEHLTEHAQSVRDHTEEVAQMAMTMAEYHIAEGEKIGRDEGEKLGREEGEKMGAVNTLRANVAAVLANRFGDLPAEVLERIGAADRDHLDRWFHQALTAPSIEAAFAID